MGELSDDLTALHTERLAAHAVAAAPVWLWSTDATRLLWANPAGAAVLGAQTFASLAQSRFDPRDQMVAQVARLGATLYPSGTTVLHRLRGFGAPLGRALLCACTRVAVAGRGAVLVVAQEPAGPRLSFAERVRRLCSSYPYAVAGFGPEGRMVAANAAASSLMSEASEIGAVVPTELSGAALRAGTAVGETAHGPVEIVRVGERDETVLLVRLPPGLAASPPAEPEVVTPPAPPEPPEEVAEAAEIASESAPEPPPAEAAVSSDEPAAASAEPPPVAADEAAWQADADDEVTGTPDEISGPRDRAETPLLRIEVPQGDRRFPLRFVWQMDAEGRFTLGSDEFTEVIGPRVALALGRPWHEIAEALGLDPDGRVIRAVETHDTWSGITVSFPVDGSEDRLDVELSGLPVYDRNRNYLGYRGFGVCRDVGRLAEVGRFRRAPLFTTAEPPARRSTDRPDPAGPRDAAQAAAATPENVVRFPASAEARPPLPDNGLSPVEHNAFREIARQLHARLAGDIDTGDEPEADRDPAGVAADVLAAAPPDGARESALRERGPGQTSTALLERMPVGVLVYRFDALIYANRTFLETTGYPDLAALSAAGGLDSLFVAGDADLATTPDPHGQPLAILTRRGDRKPVAARLFAVPWSGENAFALVLAPAGEERSKAGDLALRRAETTIRELQALLDTAFDGVVVLSRDGRIVSANQSAEVLFGVAPGALADVPFDQLFAPESREAVQEGLSRVRKGGRLALDSGREVKGLVRQGGAVPLFMTLGPMVDGSDRLCAVFRDLTGTRAPVRATTVREAAERAAVASGDGDAAVDTTSGLMAKLGHGLRTPLTAVMGFADLMLEERYGPVGNERYREYLRDVRNAAQQMASLLDDTLNLSQAECGTLELTFVSVDLNEIVQAAVKTMQPQANRERIIIRSSMAPRVPPIVADMRSLHQIILNLLGNAIRLSGPGGQVIVSTGQNQQGHVVLRVRDTGTGMSHKDLETALQPFARADTAPPAGNGLGLPLTKALAEANRGTFAITSRVNDGTLVEVTFPRPKIPAE